MTDTHAELRDKIEAMSPNQQVEVLRILSAVSPPIPLNENSNGTFVNLTSLGPSVIEKLRAYATYVDEQQTHLSIAEKEMERLGNTYFNGNKDCDGS
jgi:hypothetical protein